MVKGGDHLLPKEVKQRDRKIERQTNRERQREIERQRGRDPELERQREIIPPTQGSK